MSTVVPRPTPPRQDCPDVADCEADATEIGHICNYGPICGTCIVYRVVGTHHGLLNGTCRLRPDRGDFSCTAAICDAYIPRAGARNASGEEASADDRRVPLPVATDGRRRRAVPVATAPVRRTRTPDGPVGELEMTRDELKALIREAMDEERGGAEVPLAGKWSGGTMLLRPASAELQPKELPIDALFHKVVMIRDRLRVLEQKLNAHPQLDATEKVEMQGYITKCYGSLTTLNVLFRDREDQFQGEKTSAKDDA